MRPVYSFGQVLLLMGAAVALLAQDGVIRLPTAPPAPQPQTPVGARGPDDGNNRSNTASNQPLAPAGMQEGVAPPVDPNTFKVGPEDVLEIQVWREPQLSGQVVVRPDGKITVTLIGELDVGGKTLQEITKVLTDKYSSVMNDPVVSVQPRSIRSSKYWITGSVNKPGMYVLVVDTTVLEAIIMAGGLQEYANAKKIRIQRKDQSIYFNYTEVSKGKKLEQNIKLQNGDTIFVTQ